MWVSRLLPDGHAIRSPLPTSHEIADHRSAIDLLNLGYRHSNPISTPKRHPWGPTFGCICTRIHGGGSLAMVAREPPEWVPNRTIRPWGLFVLPHSLYIPSRARVGRIGSDSMIHILQSVTFGMSGFGLLTLFCEMFQTGEIRGPQNDAIWDPFGTPKWTPFGTPKWDPFWALFWTPK